jgi:hypothetical protein
VVQACRADSNWQLPSFTCAEGGRARTRTRTAPAGGRRQEAAGVRRAEPGHAATYLPQVMTRCLMAVRWPMYMSPPPPHVAPRPGRPVVAERLRERAPWWPYSERCAEDGRFRWMDGSVPMPVHQCPRLPREQIPVEQWRRFSWDRLLRRL